MSRGAFALAATLVLLVFASRAGPGGPSGLYGLPHGTPPHLVSFDPLGPTIALTSNEVINGLVDPVVGFDISPRDGGMYVLTDDASGNAKLYSLDPTTASATLIGPLTADPADTSSPYTGLTVTSGHGVGTDFNPQSNLLRVITLTSNQNLRVDPANARVTTDTDITPFSAGIPAVAFDNNDNDLATNTVEYVYEFTGDDWGKVGNPMPNGGVYQKIADNNAFASQPPSARVQLDEAPSGAMYATHLVSGAQNLYSVTDIATAGTHTLIGPIGVNLVGMSAAVKNLIGVDSPNITAGEGAGTARVTVTRRNPTGSTTVNYSTANGTALGGTDYTPMSGSLDFAPGEVAKTISIPLTDDTTDEPNKNFDVNVSLPPGAEALLAQNPKTTVTIADDDPAPVQPGPPPDRDGDGVPDSTDNCPNVSNANQDDGGGDGLGAVRDPGAPGAVKTGRCANQRLGTNADESLAGTLAGDTLKGFGGDDSLFGSNGDDCLSGGRGDYWGAGRARAGTPRGRG